MSRISDAFKNKPLFIPYFPIGFPSYEKSIDIIEAFAKNGAGIIEVGLSFSDPLADGPVIQKATKIALDNGINTKLVLKAVSTIRKRGITIPIILMGYLNPMHSYGFEKFIRESKSSGVDGIIIPDLPLEESLSFKSLMADLPLIQMIAPTTPEERIEKITKQAEGFIYLVSVTGVTGSRDSIAQNVEVLVKLIRKYTSIPVCVGFGISNTDQAEQIGKFSDGIIIGSHLVESIGSSKNPKETAVEIAKLMCEALARARFEDNG